MFSSKGRVISKFYNAVRKIHPQFGYRESDLFISSYPKSGRNWVHFLLANTFLVYSEDSEEINFHNISEWISEDFPEKPPVHRLDLPRIVAKHEAYSGQQTKTLYLLRHPADVMVSYYHYLTGRVGMDIESLSTLIRNVEYGIPAWIRHVKSWEGTLNLLVKYEDLKRNPLDQLDRIMKLVGVHDQVSQGALEKAVARSSFENMKRVEEKWGLPIKKGKNPNFTFMREGSSTRGEELFSGEDYYYLERMAGSMMKKYDYSLSNENVS